MLLRGRAALEAQIISLHSKQSKATLVMGKNKPDYIERLPSVILSQYDCLSEHRLPSVYNISMIQQWPVTVF